MVMGWIWTREVEQISALVYGASSEDGASSSTTKQGSSMMPSLGDCGSYSDAQV